MWEELFESLGLKQKGITDYDDMTPEEQSSYLKMLDIQESAQITLEDVKKHITIMRQSVEMEVARMPINDPKFEMYRARQFVYILMENVFSRPDRAREMLKQHKSRANL